MLETNTKFTWRKAYDLIKDYFVNSDEKLTAWLYLTGAALSVMALVGLMVAFGIWTSAFWVAIGAKALTPFFICMAQFAGLLSAFVGVYVLKTFLIDKLAILWRNWLTAKTIKQLFDSENNYLDLKRFSSEIDNISQRIQEDIKNFVDLTLNLGADLIKSVLSLGAFVGTLWIVGGSLAFVLFGLNIVIPGYLVWVALLIAAAATVATYFIGRSLPAINQQVERTGADLRQELDLLNNDAENIAQEHAEPYYKKNLEAKLQDVNDAANQKLKAKLKLTAFQNFYMELSSIVPTLLSAPLYFAGLIELGQLMQIGMAFSEVNGAFSWFVGTSDYLATYKASINRIVELKVAFEKDGLTSNPKAIIRTVGLENELSINDLDIMRPQTSSTGYIMKKLTMTFTPGVHTLIKAPSGFGKSMLLKVISGIYEYGKGIIKLPFGKRMYFLPQEPTIPNDTLMAALAYPDPVETYTEEHYIEVLKAVGGMDDFISRLHEKNCWSTELSPGERQRISFARAFLKKADWLILDEATASLDEESEARVYALMTKQPGITIVSVAHRSTVEKHHPRIVFFSANDEKETMVSEIARSNQGIV